MIVGYEENDQKTRRGLRRTKKERSVGWILLDRFLSYFYDFTISMVIIRFPMSFSTFLISLLFLYFAFYRR